MFLLGPPHGALGRGQKVKSHFISVTKSISKIFTPIFVCVLTNKRYYNISKNFFCSVPCVLPQSWDLGRWGLRGGRQGGQKKKIPNILVWHIKLKGMMSRTECK